MTPVRIALIYFGIASLWILLSDRLLFGWVADDSSSFLFWQTAKGWLFVVVSSLIIYLLAFRLNWALSRQLDLKRRHLSLIRRKAYTDYLTGLPNRRHGQRAMRRLVRQAERSGYGFCLMLLDLDDIKQVNDNLGHRTGDELIAALARRLESQLGPGEQLIHQVGDEFLLLCAGAEGRHRVAARAGRVLEAVSQPLTLRECTVTITTSVGIACYPEDGTELAVLMRSADLALHHSKRYKNCFNFYQTEFANSLQLRFDLQQRLRDALGDEQLTVYFQPIYDLARERFAGAEALVRWPTEQGFISPAEFVPVAEQSGLIRQLSYWVYERAFRETVRLQHDTGLPLTISVNVSPKQFFNAGIVDDLEALLASTGIDPGSVILEITEGVLLSNVMETSDALRQLIERGFVLSMDDFGQGYSSLNYLRQHPFRYLKIDRSFIQGMETSDQDRALVAASVAMARALQLKVVAEGVETWHQRETLAGMEVDYLQGFHLARPMPAEDYRRLLLEREASA